tara:strand:+ start:9138 stop:9389 length:252 start_codon:yes stop_codon:yes gene_type:complete
MKVTSIDHLKELSSTSNGDFVDFYILFGGVARSSKRIVYHAGSDEFSIIHEIDESYQEVITKNLGQETMVVEAIEKGVLFLLT